MKVLLTGVSGFIGCRTAEILAGRGHAMVATGRVETEVEKTRVERLARAGVIVHAGTLLDSHFAATLVNECDAVIHLAAAQHEGNVPDSYFREVNVEGTRNLIEAAVSARVRRFVYGSTIGIYGSAVDGTLDEKSPPRPENIYQVTKLEAEKVVAQYSAKIETCIARISETYGPGDLRLLKLFRGVDRGAFWILGSGQNLRQVIYVDDLADALLLAATHPAAAGQTFVFAGNQVMTTQTMIAEVAVGLGRRPSRLRIPIWPFRAAAAVFEATLRPLGIQPPLTQRRLDFFTKSFLFSTEKYKRVLEFTPQTTFADGAARTARWYRENGYL